jgi:hypothetical protein
VHRDSVKDDCRACHTSIPAEDAAVARKVVDFSGVSAACVSCHKDQHKGEFGPAASLQPPLNCLLPRARVS